MNTTNITNTITLFHPDKHHRDHLIARFQDALPSYNVVAWSPDVQAKYLLMWKPDERIFSTQGLEAVFGLGAGVDAILAAPNLPDHVQVVRLEEAGMGKQMLEIALYGILHHSRDMIALNHAQQHQQWKGESAPKRLPFSVAVGVMGLGQLGGFVAQALANVGYAVSGYSRSPKTLTGVTCYAEDKFHEFLANSEVLINLLPLTPQTEDILNADLFAQLPKGAYVINLARGKHLVEEALIPALNSGQLSGALLDVFRVEPLPKDHPFWTDHRITITPHLAAITLQDEAIKQISQNILAAENHQPMTGVVDRQRGY